MQSISSDPVVSHPNLSELLYSGQKDGYEAVNDGFIPYTSKYYADSEGLKKYALVAYVHTRNFVCHVVNFTSYVYDCLVEIVKFIANGLIAFDKNYIGIANTSFVQWIGRNVYPINQVNGRRHLIIMPEFFERAIGELAYFSITSSVPKCYDHFRDDTCSIQSRVSSVVGNISRANVSFFNDTSRLKATVIEDGQENAFAVPGGKMAVSKLLARKIDFKTKEGSNKINESVIKLADGTKVTVDLSSVSRQDVLAALLGHEMKHVASRDSIVRLAVRLVLNIALCMARYILVTLYAKHNEKKVRSNDPNDIEATEQPELQDHRAEQNPKEDSAGVEGFSSMISWLSEHIEHLNLSLKSQRDEYEADSTGMFFAKNAGYNPLGAIALQEILKSDSEIGDLYHKYFEFSLTHPYSNHRLVSLLAAYEKLVGTVEAKKVITGVDESKEFSYIDLNSSNPAVKWSQGFKQRLLSENAR